MRIVVDMVAAQAGTGGPYTHAREFMSAWAAEFPDDEIILVGPEWVDEMRPDAGRWRFVRHRGASTLTRLLGHQVRVPWAALTSRADATLTTLPMIGYAKTVKRRYCFAHDWRHLQKPSEFSRAQRLYRRRWLSSVKAADVAFCISRKTLDETRALVPGAHLALAENGCDHATRWPQTRDLAPDRVRDVLLAFGHRNNKRPDLAIGALPTVTADLDLVVVGAAGEQRTRLEALAREEGVADRCRFPGFVSDDQVHALYARAAAVLLLSSDEGFGLPAGEALALGIPVVGTTDGGLADVFGNRVGLAEPDADAVARAIDAALAARPEPAADLPTWAAAVRTVRDEIGRHA
ncbi:glycosyltransferase [Microbacterium hominis]|uniref:Glycosyltransferase n=1 Tax=Microbacterium hominis TaxID=162426 RepID=A0A7D4UK29_9MICO|nr:glycosyltransferase [Microbacterium hominis]QKJ20267.1 glycosyltransferase [Microbacterium hominis]